MAHRSTFSAKPAGAGAAIGFSPAPGMAEASAAQRAAWRRRRRELLEVYFGPVFSEAALPSAVDRLVLWRSRHGRRWH